MICIYIYSIYIYMYIYIYLHVYVYEIWKKMYIYIYVYVHLIQLINPNQFQGICPMCHSFILLEKQGDRFHSFKLQASLSLDAMHVDRLKKKHEGTLDPHPKKTYIYIYLNIYVDIYIYIYKYYISYPPWRDHIGVELGNLWGFPLRFMGFTWGFMGWN